MTWKQICLAVASVVLAGCTATQTSRVGGVPPLERQRPPQAQPPQGDFLPETGPLPERLYTPPIVAQSPDSDALVRIALLLPFTSPHRRVRDEVAGLISAIELAMFDSGGDRIVLLLKDTSSGPGQAATAATEALEEGAKMIIGPLFSANVRAISSIASAAGVPVLSFSTDSEAAGNGVYLLSLSPRDEVYRVIDWVVLQGVNRLAMFAPRSVYGRRIEQALRDRAGLHDVPVITVQTYQRTDDSPMQPARALAEVINGIAGSAADRVLGDEAEDALEEQLQDIRDAVGDQSDATGEIDTAPIPDRFDESDSPDQDQLGIGGFRTGDIERRFPEDIALAPPLENVAVLIPEGGLRLRTVAPLLPFFDVDLSKVRLLGTGLWNDPDVWREPTLIGGVFAAPDPRRLGRFVTAYRAAFGSAPPLLASLGYDAVLLAIQLGNEGDMSRASLERWQGFVGANGAFRFGANGLNERALAVLRVTRRGSVAVLEAAEDGFLPPLSVPEIDQPDQVRGF